MSLSVRVRFEVFKRDRFTCQYCGQTPPKVLLEVDHIVPRAASGSDEMENLVTSCQDCNRGKGAGLLEEGSKPAVSRSTVEEMQERIDQAKAYMEALGSLEQILDQQVERVTAAWARAFGAWTEERSDGTYWTFGDYGRFPEERSIRRFLRDLPLAFLLEAVDITAGRIGRPNQDACRYFYGVCHREREKRGA